MQHLLQVAKDRFGKLLGHDCFTRGWAAPFYYNIGSKRGLGDAAVIIRAMATYAIGDVQGSFDLHLLALAQGSVKAREDDTLGDVIAAPDRDGLLDWLRHRPLVHVAANYALVHAGLLPQWDVATAKALAGEVETELRGPRHREFLAQLYGSRPDRWDDKLRGIDRLRVIVNAMTRLRFCTPEGVMEFHTKGETAKAPAGYLPWFEVPGRKSADHTLICGHWSALGLRIAPNLLALDSGCVWGGNLSAVRLEDRRLYQVPCAADAAHVKSPAERARPGPRR